jgi:hypothetical protein
MSFVRFPSSLGPVAEADVADAFVAPGGDCPVIITSRQSKAARPAGDFGDTILITIQ